jgi:hypothetical protein
MTRSLILLAIALAGCSSSSSSSPSSSSGETTPSPDAYKAWCDHQVAAGCKNTPAGYADSCKTLYGNGRTKIKPDCQAKYDALMECGADKETYTCNASGSPEGSPQGACASEGSACDACNGSSCLLAIIGGGS